MTTLTLVLFCRANKTFQVGGITTFATSIFLLVCTSGVKESSCCSLLAFDLCFCFCVGLGFVWGFCFLYLPCGSSVCWCLSEVNLSSLHFTCHLLYMPGCSFWALIFLCKLVHLLAGNLFQIYTTLINGFRHKFFISQVEPKDVPMQDLCSFRWVFHQIDLGLYTVVPFIHTFGPLAKACQQVKSGTYFIVTEACRTPQTGTRLPPTLIHLLSSPMTHTGPFQNSH